MSIFTWLYFALLGANSREYELIRSEWQEMGHICRVTTNHTQLHIFVTESRELEEMGAQSG